MFLAKENKYYKQITIKEYKGNIMSRFCSTTFTNNVLKLYLEVELQMDIQLMQVPGAFPGDHCGEE